MYQHTRLTFVTALAALCAGCAALPTDADYTGANNVVAGAEGQAVRECRWAGATGTKMRTRIYYSQEEWAAIDAANAAPQDNEDFFRRQRENSTLTGNVDVPDTTGGGLGF